MEKLKILFGNDIPDTFNDRQYQSGESNLQTFQRTLWIVLFVLFAFGLISSGFLYYLNLQRNFQVEAEEQLLAIGELKSNELARWRRERIGDGLVFHENSLFSELVKEFLKNPNDKNVQDKIELWFEQVYHAYNYESVILLTPDFKRLLNVPAETERLVSYISEENRNLLKSGQIVIQDFYWNNIKQKVYLKVLIPILDDDNDGALLAVVGLRIDPQDCLYPYLSRWPGISETAETLLVRNDGKEVIFLNALRFNENAALRLRIPLENQDIISVQAVKGNVGITIGRDYRGVSVIADTRPVPDSPWFIISRIDQSEVFAPLRTRLIELTLIIAAILIATGGLIRLAIRQNSIQFYKQQYEDALAIAESKLRLDTITNSAQDAILMMDDQGLITFWNPAAERILGYSKDEAVGKNLHALLAPEEYHAAFQAAFPEFQVSGQGPAIGKTHEMKALRKDGKEIDISLGLSSVRMDRRWYAVGILKDISDRKQAEFKMRSMVEDLARVNVKLEEAVERANQAAIDAQSANIAKSQFLANMSHEIRTPMNGVIGMTELLAGTDLTEEQRRFVNVIQNSAESLLSVINDILDYSKIDAGKLDIEVIDFDLRTMLEDTAEMLAVRAQEKGLEFTLRVDPEINSRLRGDPVRLRQILVNLGGNAIKFTPSGEVSIQVTVEAKSGDHQKLRFEVKDTGIGIPIEKQDILFNAFEQVDASTTRRYGGTGLGLAISKHLAKLLGGEIGVISSLGEGSTFWFTANFDIQTGLESEILHPPVAIRGSRMLVVDDNPTNRMILAEQLESWGVRHQETDSAGQAIQLLKNAHAQGDPFSVLITDMQMPDVDGEMLCQSVKSDPEIADTLMILMTSLGWRGDAKRLREIGFSAYLTKPVKQSHLFDCLVNVLGSKCMVQTPAPPEWAADQILEEPLRRSHRILLAEDSPVNQLVAVRMLEKMGYQVDAVADGSEAIQMLAKKPYDLVLMDVQMPVMDGFTATISIRSRNVQVLNAEIPIIAMTANAMQGDRERCLEMGMNDYISKPVRTEELARILDKWLVNQPAVVEELVG